MVNFYHRYSSLPFPASRLQKTARRIARGEKLPRRQNIDVILCSDSRIQKLNRRYLKKDRPTDVMAFTFNDTDLLGEIFISLQRAEAQARCWGLTYEEELERLLTHGIIHLLGYDHRTVRQRRIMETREGRYCKLGRKLS